MGKSYYRTPEMVEGGQFRCHNCNNLLLEKLGGSIYDIELTCERCGATYKIKCKEPIPFVAEKLRQEKARETA